MNLGIIGLPQAGKSTIFAALIGARGEMKVSGSARTDPRIFTITVPDKRVDFLTGICSPKKITFAKIEYLLPSELPTASSAKTEGSVWNQVRTCDALLHVLRNYKLPGDPPHSPIHDFRQLEEEMVLNDLGVVEKRIERIELDRKRGKKPGEQEHALLKSCLDCLEKGEPLRNMPELAANPVLKGFTFLTAKPMLVVVNNNDDDEAPPKWDNKPEDVEIIVVRGRLEEDLASMSSEEAKEFLDAYNIRDSALDRVIKSSCNVLNRIFFFTIGSDEVKAWPISAGTQAMRAAREVHSDIEKGFIRAEVLAFEAIKAHGSFKDAKKAGVVQLEGKEYEVKDGDIINFRFNV